MSSSDAIETAQRTVAPLPGGLGGWQNLDAGEIIRPAERRDPYKRCKTGLEGCYFNPDTDPSRHIDGNEMAYLVGQTTAGRTNFNHQDKKPPWKRPRWKWLKEIDDGIANLTYANETTTGPFRVNDREVYTTRRAESVACQIGLPDWHRQEVSRMIAETKLQPWNWLGGIDAAILGMISYVLKGGLVVLSESDGLPPRRPIDGWEDALEHPVVQDAIDIFEFEAPDKVISYTFDRLG